LKLFSDEPVMHYSGAGLYRKHLGDALTLPAVAGADESLLADTGTAAALPRQTASSSAYFAMISRL
jgi:hypothetical protein